MDSPKKQSIGKSENDGVCDTLNSESSAYEAPKQ